MLRPNSDSIDVTRSCRSGGYDATDVLMPNPRTTRSPAASARIPASFRRDTYRSLGHLRSARSPLEASIPSASATPAASVSSSVARLGSDERPGARTTDAYNPLPGGENHV